MAACVSQTALVIKAEQLLARLHKHGLGLTIKRDLKEVAATLRDQQAPIVLRILTEQVGSAWKLRESQGTDRAIFVIAKVSPQLGHHSVKLTN